jgi:hypothetical protein
LIEYNVDTINAQAVLKVLAYAIELGYVDDIVKLLSMMDVYCSDECDDCGGYTDINDYETRVLNDPSVTLGGGDIV